MKNAKLKLDYSQLSDAKLAIRSNDVIVALTGNLNFPVTNPTVAQVALLRTAYMEALDKTVNGDRYFIAVKNQAKTTLADALWQLAMDISAQANGDKAKLLTSGFELAAAHDLPTVLGVPTDFKITDGANPGELILTCSSAQNANSYLFDLTDDPNSATQKWTTHAGSRRTLTVKNLISGTRYYGRIRAIGTKGQETCTEVLSRVVQ